jgi:hypothetical protein
VQGDEIGLLQQVVQLHHRDAYPVRPVLRDERVVGDDVHLEAARHLGHLGAYLTEAHHAEGLAAKLDALEGAVPLAALQFAVSPGNLAHEGHHERDAVLSGGDGVAERGVDDHDAVFGGGFDVDIVHADAGPADDAQLAGMGQKVGCDLGLGADHQRVILTEDSLQLLWRQTLLDVHLTGRLQYLNRILGDCLRHEYPGCALFHVVLLHALSKSARAPELRPAREGTLCHE